MKSTIGDTNAASARLQDHERSDWALTPGYTSKAKSAENNALNRLIEKFVACGGVIKKLKPSFNFRKNDLYRTY
jgi:hypothetical protein